MVEIKITQLLVCLVIYKTVYNYSTQTTILFIQYADKSQSLYIHISNRKLCVIDAIIN